MTSTGLETVQQGTPRRRSRSTVLVLSQVFLPDPASLGQHMGDVAAEMAARGHRVIVLTSNRGYDNPSVRYPAREVMNGVEIRRIPCSSFGKSRFFLRVIAAILFTIQAAFIGLFTRGLDCVLASTAPPLCGVAALIIHLLRGIPYVYWVMDLNPDQLIALKSLKQGSRAVRFLDASNRFILARASSVVALDRFMAERIRLKANLNGRLQVLPPWPHEKHLGAVNHSDNPFRRKHHLQDKFVFMYSGNHSASNPLATILEAAVHFRDDPRVAFLFIGGGLAKQDVEQVIRDHGLTNVLSLPYQPLSELKYSLSAADVHIVSLGDPFVGIIHPCKIYGAMASARPILFLGPRPSHITDLLDDHRFGWHVAHGDVRGAIDTIESIRCTGQQELTRMGMDAQRIVRAHLGQAELCSAFCQTMEDAMAASEVKAVVRAD